MWIQGNPAVKEPEGLETPKKQKKSYPQNQLNRAHGGSQKLKSQLQTLYGSELGPLCIAYVFIAGCSCGIPNNRIVFDSCVWFWDPFFPIG